MTADTVAPGFATVNTDTVLERLDRFAYWTDECISIPGLDTRIGLDPLIGLIPVWGDTVGALVSCYVPYEAYRAGAPPSLILKMLAIIVAEGLVGVIPLVGDLIDALFKANRVNVRLLRDYLAT
jgi:predicted aconitase with swiveling domain